MSNLWVLLPAAIMVAIGTAVHQILYYTLFSKDERKQLKLKREILNKGR